ncbi:MAG: slipin family protein [Methylobacteriaceae bacterium]|nr:slipin family protein [Methylobacteriaceae bacterium]
MKRTLFRLCFTVKDGEIALLTREGRLERALGPGRHALFDPLRRLSAEIVSIVRAEFPVERARLIARTRPELAAELFEIVEAKAGEVCVVSLDGEPKHLVPKFTSRAYLKGATRIEVERIDTQRELRVPAAVLAKLDLARTPQVLEARVAAHEAGLLFVDGVLTERLGPGRHAFWQTERKVAAQTFDLRPQPLEISAQEILTKDKIALRLTLTAFTRIVDPVKASQNAVDVQTAIYRLAQFAIREAVATRTLDEVLAARERIDEELRGFVAARSADLGVETTELGVKDVILPGDVRALVNKVVEAERTAKANLIRRQEETAATRSLLNTAKLMQENPLLVRLKELEALEKLTEKVGRIDLHASDGAGLDALLTKLWRVGEAT